MAKKTNAKRRKVDTESSPKPTEAPSVESEEKMVHNKAEKVEESKAPPTQPTVPTSDGRYHNKQRCLVLCSRGVTARYRHLLEDLRTLMPHHKRESKLDPGSEGVGRAVNDIAEMRSCSTILFLECRKHQDAYMWVGRPQGPSAKYVAVEARLPCLCSLFRPFAQVLRQQRAYNG